jgi:nicotinamidase-related amidase
MITLDRPALLVVDMQNGFCHERGSFAGLGFDVSPLRAAIPGCRALVDGARAAGVPVIFTRFVYQPGYVDGGVVPNELLPAIKERGCLAAGSWDAEIVDELVRGPDDVVIDKSRYSSFYGTRLEPVLNSLGTASLVICGVTTNMCVETTARDASQRDYRTFVVEDATGELDPDRHRHALEALAFGFGWVVPAADVLAAWGPAPDASVAAAGSVAEVR